MSHEPCFAYYQKSAVIGDATILPIQIRDKASNFNDNEYSKMGVPFCSAPDLREAELFGDFPNRDSNVSQDYYIIKAKPYLKPHLRQDRSKIEQEIWIDKKVFITLEEWRKRQLETIGI